MKKALAWLLIVALTAAVAVGGTMAYLTDTDEDTNVMTLGNVKIDQLEYERVDVESKDDDAIVQEFHDNKPLYPAVTEDGFNWTTDASVDWSQIGKDGYTSGIWDPERINNEQDKMVFVKNKGTSDAYVRSIFAFEANGYTLDQFNELFHLNINETDWTWEWVETPVSIPNEDGTVTTNYIVATATYNKVLKPGEFTEISLSQIALDPTAGNEDIAGFGETYQILVKTQAVQTEGFENPQEALNKGFGEVKIENLPFENDSAVLGIDLRTALHYLDGDTTGTKITAKVTNVYFELNQNYPEIVNNYEGTLVDVEQDVPVYAYYVPNGSNYDVYFLANDTIYAPKDSSSLFEDMTEVMHIETANLDLGRVEIAARMFRQCKKLLKLDTADWDTSNMKSMERLFVNCYQLENVDVSKWDTSNVSNFSMVFYGCKAMDYVDVTNWDTSKGVVFNSIFAYSPKINLNKDDLQKWDMGSAVKINHMFYGCSSLEELDLSGWNMPNVTTTSHMFADCVNLKSVNFDGWYTPSLTSMDAMFNDCHSLTVLDLSSFDTSNCLEFSQIFEACWNLQYIKGLEKWDTTKGATFEQTFSGCGALKELDLSSFNSRSVVNDYYPMQNGSTGWGFKQMFTGVKSLEKLVIGADFSFDGDGKVTTESYKVAIPAPAAKEGFTAKWRNVETGEVYLASEIPEETAATYVAYYEANSTT